MNPFESACGAFESALAAYSLNVAGLPKVKEIEDHVLPSMHKTYFQTLLGGDLLRLAPTQSAFVDCMASQTLSSYPYLKNLEIALRARLSRNYPPFVRHHHLLLIAKQCRGVDVFYSRKMDEAGIDVLLRSSVRKNFVGVLSMTETKRSAEFSAEKRSNRNELPFGLPPIIPHCKRRIGEFDLHDCTPIELTVTVSYTKSIMMFSDFSPTWQQIVLAAGCRP
jgi:hypothetical protein